jgi:hypothetical protein
MAAAHRLHIWVGQQHAATLSFADQKFTLNYTTEWQQSKVSQYDVFGILRKVGRDCAGALVITESRAQDVPLMFWRGKRRMSLPGMQNKLGVHMDASGGLWLPKDGAPTSHILKVGDDRHPGMVPTNIFA